MAQPLWVVKQVCQQVVKRLNVSLCLTVHFALLQKVRCQLCQRPQSGLLLCLGWRAEEVGDGGLACLGGGSVHAEEVVHAFADLALDNPDGAVPPCQAQAQDDRQRYGGRSE